MLHTFVYAQHKDLSDVAHDIFPKLSARKDDSMSLNRGQKILILLPSIGYTLQNGFLGQVVANKVFKQPQANVSTTSFSATYTQHSQTIVQNAVSYFSKDNQWFLSRDWRFMHP